MSSVDREPEAIVWFRRDLRLSDNPAWSAATRDHSSVCGLFVVDERLMAAASPRRRAMLLGHLRALDASLAERGGRLRVEIGDPRSAIPRLAAGRPVYACRDHSPAARRRDEAVLAGRADLSLYDGVLVHPPGTVLTARGEMYRVFTPFHRAWSALPLPTPAVEGEAVVANDRGAGLPVAETAAEDVGEVAATVLARRAVADAASYVDRRDRIDLDATSHLSQHLKFGTISAAEIVRLAKTAGGADAFVRQIAWRDFHAHTMWFEPNAVTTSLRPELRAMPWVDDDEGFAAWCAGMTGFPLVDASARQLLAEGFVPNRARMVSASFLVKDLGVDWRRGETHYRYHLVDGDVAQNVGNWQWVGGIGRDAAPYFRIFNPSRQSARFDPDGAYIRRWLPELRRLRAPAIHEPAAHPAATAAAGIRLGVDYPFPIVDHAEARMEAMARYRAAVAAR